MGARFKEGAERPWRGLSKTRGTAKGRAGLVIPSAGLRRAPVRLRSCRPGGRPLARSSSHGLAAAGYETRWNANGWRSGEWRHGRRPTFPWWLGADGADRAREAAGERSDQVLSQGGVSSVICGCQDGLGWDYDEFTSRSPQGGRPLAQCPRGLTSFEAGAVPTGRVPGFQGSWGVAPRRSRQDGADPFGAEVELVTLATAVQSARRLRSSAHTVRSQAAERMPL